MVEICDIAIKEANRAKHNEEAFSGRGWTRNYSSG
jgi:hypothetical protein